MFTSILLMPYMHFFAHKIFCHKVLKNLKQEPRKTRIYNTLSKRYVSLRSLTRSSFEGSCELFLSLAQI